MLKNSQKGFSLMEILIAVGLMAIISAIAVPNYLKYTRNAKTAEAQSSLGQIYMAEKSFYLQWRFYTVDLVVAGVAPDGNLLYNAGFSGSGGTIPTTYQGPDISDSNNTLYKICGQGFGTGTVKNCAFSVKTKDTYTGFEPPGITDAIYDTTDTTFTAVAVADIINKIPSSTATKKDVWSIDNYKQIIRKEDGT